MFVPSALPAQKPLQALAARPADPVPVWAREAAGAVTRALGPRGAEIDWSRTTFSRGHAEAIDVQVAFRDGSRRSLVVTDQFANQLQVMTPRAYQARVGF